MRILALIPARAGSKRLPGKNAMLLGGIPLITWSIRSALESGCCEDVLVSTDDPDIARIAKEDGASVPWLRPPTLSTDTATSVDVALHALDWWENTHGHTDGLLLLQPTSPFRSPHAVQKVINLFRAHLGTKPVVSLSPARTHPAWCFSLRQSSMEPILGWDALAGRSQELEPAWCLNGSIYLASPTQLRTQHRFLTNEAIPFRMECPGEAIDIDTAADWTEAAFFAQNLIATTPTRNPAALKTSSLTRHAHSND